MARWPAQMGNTAPRPEAWRNGGHLVRSLPDTLRRSRRLTKALGPLVRDPEADSTRTAAEKAIERSQALHGEIRATRTRLDGTLPAREAQEHERCRL